LKRFLAWFVVDIAMALNLTVSGIVARHLAFEGRGNAQNLAI
jgi:hypothetical protein